MKTLRLITASLLIISGVLHVFFAFKFKDVTNNALAYWMGVGILYLVLGVLFLIKKRFAFWLGLIPIIVSIAAPTGSGYKVLINVMWYNDLLAVIGCMALIVNFKRDAKSIKRFRWMLRVLSGLIILIIIYAFIYNAFFPQGGGEVEPSRIKDLLWVFAPWGLGLIGFGLAWKWELIGGIVALSGFVVWCIDNPSTLQNYFVFIYPIIAILFIVLWAISRNTTVKNS